MFMSERLQTFFDAAGGALRASSPTSRVLEAHEQVRRSVLSEARREVRVNPKRLRLVFDSLRGPLESVREVDH
jgi:hypothetical protein